MNRQEKRPLADLLQKYTASDRVSLHIPGHKGGADIEGMQGLTQIFPREVLRADITEIDGFDDLHCPEGVIAEAQQLAAELFGAEETFFLVNGTTSGIIAAVAAAAYEGAPILVGRDCHKSVTRGLIFSGAEPIYIDNSFDESLGIPVGLCAAAVEEALRHNPGVRVLILTNPSYYGTCSDLKTIVDLCHERDVLVIADEAHGAQTYFSGQEGICSALSAGCDISVQSTHKMLGSLTQSSMLHVKGNLADRERLRYLISLMNTTSPSYLLMASLDAVRADMASAGKDIWHRVISMTEEAAERIKRIPYIRCITEYTDADGNRRPVEGSRLLISAAELGISGRGLADILCRRYHIDVEFADHLYVIAVFGSGTAKRELRLLEDALMEIADSFGKKTDGIVKDTTAADTASDMDGDADNNRKNTVFENRHNEDFRREAAERNTAPGKLNCRCAMTPRKAFYSQHETIPLSDAAGKTSAFDVAVYPPGIPALYPGQEISEEICDYLFHEFEAGNHIHGITCGEKGDPLICVVTGEVESMLFQMFF